VAVEYKGTTSWLYSLPKPQQEFSRQEGKVLGAKIWMYENLCRVKQRKYIWS